MNRRHAMLALALGGCGLACLGVPVDHATAGFAAVALVCLALAKVVGDRATQSLLFQVFAVLVVFSAGAAGLRTIGSPWAADAAAGLLLLLLLLYGPTVMGVAVYLALTGPRFGRSLTRHTSFRPPADARLGAGAQRLEGLHQELTAGIAADSAAEPPTGRVVTDDAGLLDPPGGRHE